MRTRWKQYMMLGLVMGIGLVSPEAAAESGAQLFADHFGGNGNSCEGCHREGSLRSVSPALATQLCGVSNPTDPLCIGLNGINGLPDLSDLMARTRVGIPFDICAPNVTVSPASDNAVVESLPNGCKRIFIQLRIPTTIDIGVKKRTGAPFMPNGDKPDLTSQALGAIHTHNGPLAQAPNLKRLEKLVKFELSEYSSKVTRKLGEQGKAPKLPMGGTPELVRGASLVLDPMGPCANCHAGPGLNQVGEHNVISAISHLPDQFWIPFFSMGDPPLATGSVWTEPLPTGGFFASNLIGAAQPDMGRPKYRFEIKYVDEQGNPIMYENPLTGFIPKDENGNGVPTTFIFTTDDPGATITEIDDNGNVQPCRADPSICRINHWPVRFDMDQTKGQASLNTPKVIPSLLGVGDRMDAGHVLTTAAHLSMVSLTRGVYQPLFGVTGQFVGIKLPARAPSLDISQLSDIVAIEAYQFKCLRDNPYSECYASGHYQGDEHGCD